MIDSYKVALAVAPRLCTYDENPFELKNTN